MASKRLNPRLAKLHRTYAVEEIASLYSVHPNSVRAWLKTGLVAIDDARPLLVQGAELRRFLTDRRASAKRPCPVGTLFCFKCKAPRAPALGMADFVSRHYGAGNVQALCESCGTLMFRRIRREDIPAILPGASIQFAQQPERLGECLSLRSNCDQEVD